MQGQALPGIHGPRNHRRQYETLPEHLRIRPLFEITRPTETRFRKTGTAHCRWRRPPRPRASPGDRSRPTISAAQDHLHAQHQTVPDGLHPPPHVALPHLGTCDDRPHRGRRLVRPHLHEDDDTPQSVPHPDEINTENERKKFRSFHARPKPHPAFGEKERVLRTPPDEIRLSFPFQDNITIKQD